MTYTSLTINKRFSGSYSFVFETGYFLGEMKGNRIWGSLGCNGKVNGCFIGETMRWILDKWRLEIRDRDVGFFLTWCIRGCFIES